MASDIPADLRRLVAERAELCCEYCLLPEAFALRKHEPDHIIPRQHGGETNEANLALACARCNRAKGPNLGSLDAETGELVRFFDPRRDAWSDHFRLDGALIAPLTARGRVTVKIFQLNQPHRIAERLHLVDGCQEVHLSGALPVSQLLRSLLHLVVVGAVGTVGNRPPRQGRAVFQAAVGNRPRPP